MIDWVRTVPRRMLSGGSGGGATALLFPGQGSQSVGMLADLVRIPAVAKLLAQVDPELRQVMDQGPRRQLALTQWTQPAVYVAALCHYERWRHEDQGAARPTRLVMLGHSVGEYAALSAAGLISFQQGLQLVVGRRVPGQGDASHGLNGSGVMVVEAAGKDYGGAGLAARRDGDGHAGSTGERSNGGARRVLAADAGSRAGRHRRL